MSDPCDQRDITDQHDRTSPVFQVITDYVQHHTRHFFHGTDKHHDRGHPEEVMITCRAGTAAIINQSVFHANYPNVSEEDRRLLAIAYRPAWAGPIGEVPDWPADKVAALPNNVRPLFQSLNTRKIEYDLPNRPPNMKTEAPGINPSRWNV